ncbi:MAG: hypothetical protein E7133_07810 [Rikenellaceae bacterium]|nr:hypothetical protein [Rikenellaceae bacterium]
MKKFLLAVAAFGMLVTSCAKDETTQGDNSSVVSFKVSAPKLQTRADIKDVYGTGFTAEDLEYAIYEADAEGNLKDNTPEIKKEVAGAFADNALETTFSERLVNGKHYVILFWADATDDPYTVDWDTQTISLTNPAALNAQNESHDAFYKKIFFTVKSGQLEQTAVLSRPFAQLNVGVSDTAAAATAGLKVAQTELVVTTYTALNLFDGTVEGQPQQLTYKMANIPSVDNAGVQEGVTVAIENTTYDIISMNYLFVNGDDKNDDKELVDVKFNYVDEDDATVLTREYNLVPLKRNHRTFIIGDILTEQVDVKVVINPVFDNENDPLVVRHSVEDALANGGIVTLTEDVTINVDENAPQTVVENDVVIDLNGNDLIVNSPKDAIWIRVNNGATLTIDNEAQSTRSAREVYSGTIIADCYIASANEGGVIEVYDGYYETSSTTLFQANGGEVYIYGGYFKVTNEKYGTTYMLNHIDAKKNDGLIEVTGGQFEGYNPAASTSENPVMSFVPEGYAASASGVTEDGKVIYKVQEAVPMTGLTAAPAQVYQAATLGWDAVEGAVKYVVKYNGVQVAETDATTVTTDEGGVADAAVAKFSVEAFDENGGMLGYGETPETKVFTLINRPEPAVYLANGQLIVENKELHNVETIKNNLDINGVLLEAEVYFYKDGATAPTYTAVGTYLDTYPTADLPKSIEEKKMKNNVAGSYNTWKWNGGAATKTAPDFEPGTYTIKYKAGYYPIMNAAYGSDGARITYTAPSDVLATMIYREGEVEAKLAVSTTTVSAVRDGYQGALVTCSPVEGAVIYKAFADGVEKGSSETTEIKVSGLTEKKFYGFTVKAYDANGVAIATGATENEIEIYSLKDMPAPVVTFVNGTSLVADNLLDVPGVVVKLTLNFKKDGQVAYTASYDKDNTVFNAATQAAAGRFTKANFYSAPAGAKQTKWVWNDVEADVPTFEPGEYSIEYVSECYSFVEGKWGSKSGAQPFDRVFVTEATTLMEKQTISGTLAENLVVGLTVEANALVDEVILSWNSAGANATYEVYADGNKVGETTEITYACPATLGDHNYEVKVAGTTIVATASATVEYSIAHWTAPKFQWTGARIKVTELTGISTKGFAYAYGGAITNDNDTSKSTIEVYNEAGTLLYTLTNGTGQGTLTAWAGYGRWALNAQDNRQDWVWTDAAGNHINIGGGEGDIDPAKMPAGKYTLKWTIGYVVSKNSTWDKSGTTVSSRAEADRVWFGPKDTNPSPNVCYTDSSKKAVKIVTKSGEATLVIE